MAEYKKVSCDDIKCGILTYGMAGLVDNEIMKFLRFGNPRMTGRFGSDIPSLRYMIDCVKSECISSDLSMINKIEKGYKELRDMGWKEYSDI